MTKDIIWVLLLLICFVGFFIWVFTLLKKQLGRVFPYTYKTYRPTLPQALHVWRGRTGGLRLRIWFNFYMRGLMRVELFQNGLLVSAVGKALWLPFGIYKFTVSSALLGKLSVENIPVQPTPPLLGFNFFHPITTLTVLLPKKACEEILRLQEDALKQNQF